MAARLDAAVEKAMRESGAPGAIVGVWTPDRGEYVRAFGVADKATGEKMETGVYSRIGSETKTFTVTAVLQLVDQGKVGLDDPIGTYVDGVPNGDRITVRQLAEMRSGLTSYTEQAPFIDALLANPERSFTPRQLLTYAFDSAEPVLFEPGAQFNYSNTNLVLLGLVIEKATGRPANEVIEEDVVAKAGLTRTSFPLDSAFPSPHAQGYTNQTASGKTEVATDWNPSWAWTAGAMISTLDDLRKWAPVLANGTLLTPATQAERLKTHPMPVSGQAGYGLGIFDVNGWIGHNGSLPGYQSLTLHLKDPETTLVVLLNTDVQKGIHEPTTYFGRAVTEIVSPGHVYWLAPAARTSNAPATPSPSGG
ncbi:serine hydrolase domain-containing protein [Streptomyces sp. NPDC097619]|uniref:serine hydrolase domain-containing protein n=1 Tax=Streptomyces sp. NPDC097619 TaxID=3157228 RepID=UPI00331CEC72